MSKHDHFIFLLIYPKISRIICLGGVLGGGSIFFKAALLSTVDCPVIVAEFWLWQICLIID